MTLLWVCYYFRSNFFRSNFRVTFFILLNTRGHGRMLLERLRCFAGVLKRFWNPIAFMISKPVKSGTALHHHRASQARRHLWKSFSPTPLLKQGHLEQVVLDLVTYYLYGFICSFDVLSTWSDQNYYAIVLHNFFYFCQECFSKLLMNFLHSPAVTNGLIVLSHLFSF